MQRTRLLNSPYLTNQDADLSSIIEAIAPGGGVFFGGDVTEIDGSLVVNPIKALIKCIRGNGEIVYPYFWSTDDVYLTPSDGYLIAEVNQQHINNKMLNNEEGTGITTIKIVATLPLQNYVLIGQIIGGVFSDKRDFVKISAKALDESEAIKILQEELANLENKIVIIEEEGIPTSALTGKEVVGEKILRGDILFQEEMISSGSATGIQNIGDTQANARAHFPIFGSGTPGNSLQILLGKGGDSPIPLNIRIESDNNGMPSGIPLSNDFSLSISASNLATAVASKTLYFTTASSENTYNQTLDATKSVKSQYGIKISPKKTVIIKMVEKSPTCTATKAYLYDRKLRLLATASFVSNTATFNKGIVYPGDYYICVGSDGASFTSARKMGATFPVTGNSVDAITGISKFGTLTDDFIFNRAGSGSGGNGVNHFLTVQPNIDCRLRQFLPENPSGGSAVEEDGIVIETSTGTSYSGNTILRKGHTYTFRRHSYSWATGGSNAYPKVGEHLNVTAMDFSGSLQTEAMSHEETSDFFDITKITTDDGLNIPEGLPCHVVLRSGDYNSPTINPTNYYKVGFANRNTSIRGLGMFNGSTNTRDNTKMPFVLSELFKNGILAKATAGDSYRVPYVPMLAVWEANRGEVAEYNFAGITGALNDLVIGSTYYLSNTLGGASSTPGSNAFVLGRAIAKDKLLISNGGGGGAPNLVMTQAEYNALSSKSDGVIYNIY